MKAEKVRREELQKAAVEALVRDRFVMVNWGTGVGKSRVAIEAIDRLFAEDTLQVLLLVDQGIHKDNWLNEFVECKGEERGRRLYDSVTVECYASLPKYEGTEWDLIVADEAHHLRSDNRVALLSTLRTLRMLCLSATISCKGDGENLLQTLNENFGKFTTLEFGLQDAIDNEILPEPTIHVHVLPLQDLKVTQDVTEGWGPSAKRVDMTVPYAERNLYRDKKRYPAMNLTLKCTVAEAYEYYKEQGEAAKKRYKEMRENAGLAPGTPDSSPVMEMWGNRQKRCGLLAKNVIGKGKTKFAGWLVRHLADRKFICFCTDVEQALELGGDNVICNEVRDSDAVVAAFNAGEKTSLFAVNMAIEGQNLCGIEAGIVVQLAGKDRKFIQEFGRAMRAKDPQQHIIVIDGTKDVEYLRNAVATVSKDYIRVKGYGSYKDRKMTLDDLRDGREAVAAARKEAGKAIFGGLS